MYRVLNASFVSLFLAIASAPVSAGTTTGPILRYATFEVPGNPPLFFVWISGTPTNPAPCATETATGNMWATRIDTPAGRGHMAAILSAKAMGQTVSVQGKGQFTPGAGNPCDGWSNTESIYRIAVPD